MTKGSPIFTVFHIYMLIVTHKYLWVIGYDRPGLANFFLKRQVVNILEFLRPYDLCTTH